MLRKDRTPKRVDAEKLMQYAVKSLAARAQSVAELRAKLMLRAEQPGDVETVLTRLREYGYLNEQRFAENFVMARRDNDGLGRTRVLMDLRKRRVAPQVAASTVQAAYQDTDEASLIEQFLRRKYRRAERDTLFQSDSELASAYGRLRRADLPPALQ
jgi:regulatory protein